MLVEMEIWYSMLDGRRVGYSCVSRNIMLDGRRVVYSCVSRNMVFHARW